MELDHFPPLPRLGHDGLPQGWEMGTRALSRRDTQFRRHVHFIFQPARRARRRPRHDKAGCLKSFPETEVYGLHQAPDLTRRGIAVSMPARDGRRRVLHSRYRLWRVKGVAMPVTIQGTPCIAHAGQALRPSQPKRRPQPAAVLSITRSLRRLRLQNVIPGEAKLAETVRVFRRVRALTGSGCARLLRRHGRAIPGRDSGDIRDTLSGFSTGGSSRGWSSSPQHRRRASKVFTVAAEMGSEALPT